MVHNSSGPRDHWAPCAPDQAPDPAWDRELAEAFGALLGRPLDAYDGDAVYAASVNGNYLQELGLHRDPVWMRPAVLSGAEPLAWEAYVFDADPKSPVFDASRSIFEFWAGATEARAALPAGFLADVDAACFRDGLIRGAELAPLVERHGVDLGDPAVLDSWQLYFPCLRSDGTLLDALCTATATGRRPTDLLSFEVEPDEEWVEALEGIGNVELREHLAYFCTDGDEGLMPDFDEEPPGSVLIEEGCRAVIGWQDGHGQIDLVVLRLSDEAAGRR
ncbi:hypothetical protein ACIQBJ_14305 [Kitasatospora sp. NPDC088391]|uniref:hypothetical protein n=1 Tax=Kitasatospora sp. NPDC088391 TaxID=3364074 RepID=UPI00381291F3